MQEINEFTPLVPSDIEVFRLLKDLENQLQNLRDFEKTQLQYHRNLLLEYVRLQLSIDINNQAVQEHNVKLQELKRREIEITRILNSPARYINSSPQVPILVRFAFLILLTTCVVVSWYHLITSLNIIIKCIAFLIILSLIFLFERITSELSWDPIQRRLEGRDKSAMRAAKIRFWIASPILVIFLTFASVVGESYKISAGQSILDITSLFLPFASCMLGIIWIIVAHHYAVKHKSEYLRYIASEETLKLGKISASLSDASNELRRLRPEIDQGEIYLRAGNFWLSQKRRELNDLQHSVMTTILGEQLNS